MERVRFAAPEICLQRLVCTSVFRVSVALAVVDGLVTRSRFKTPQYPSLLTDPLLFV
jgi:hypothetical protein